jgi:hypothetical protein
MDEHAAVAGGSKRKRSEVCASLLSPAAKAARMGSPVGGGAAGGSRRPAENAIEVRTHVHVLYRWEWRAGNGIYVARASKSRARASKSRRVIGAAIDWGRACGARSFQWGPANVSSASLTLKTVPRSSLRRSG